MSFSNKRSYSDITEQEREIEAGTAEISELVNQLFPDEDIPVLVPGSPQHMQYTPAPPTSSTDELDLSMQPTSFNRIHSQFLPIMLPSRDMQTRQLVHNDSPNVTRALSDVLMETMPRATSITSSLRQPLLVPGSEKKKIALMRPPQGRRWVIHTAIACVMIVIGVTTLMAALPTGIGANSTGSFNPLNAIMGWSKAPANDPQLLAQQAATVRAITRDGYDPGTGRTIPGLVAPPVSAGSTLGSYAYGQCTYGADLIYHQLTGIWTPPAMGNAAQWAYAAPGWVHSSAPHVPSIIVLQGGVQGAGGFGHVAVIYKISNGTLYGRTYNWYANGGGFNIESKWNLWKPGPGVSFMWYPGK